MADCNALQVADATVYFFARHGDLITNLKLQKLLYYTQAWHLAIYDSPLFDEEFEAWVHGPVQPSVYNEYKKFGSNPIVREPGEVHIATTAFRHLVEVMKVYGGKSGFELERYTHQEDPWLNARGDIPPDQLCSRVISKDSMRAYYKARLDV